ncbi:MAG: polymer-forming cytoskeletal protein [Bdellovibrionales bacterium]|nr:polymer-forming cytoskeletal protein [Bdellovibrionales bacterium]
MKFSLSNAKKAEDKPVEQEMLTRWRAAAKRAQSGLPTVSLVEEDATEPEFHLDAGSVLEKDRAQVAASERYQGRTLPSDPGLGVEEDLQRRFGARVKEAIGAGTVIEGKLSFDAPVRIDGTLTGEVTSTSTLIVGEQGVINATIDVGSLIVLGQVTGDVESKDLVEIKAGGRLEADIRTKRIVIEDGGVFNGCCNRKA